VPDLDLEDPDAGTWLKIEFGDSAAKENLVRKIPRAVSIVVIKKFHAEFFDVISENESIADVALILHSVGLEDRTHLEKEDALLGQGFRRVLRFTEFQARRCARLPGANSFSIRIPSESLYRKP